MPRDTVSTQFRRHAGVDSCAVFSQCERYRYLLRRQWASGPPLVFVGLNPSTADAFVDDPTVRRCIGYARAWGFGGMTMLNAYAWRSTDPRGLLLADDPVGSRNDATLRLAAADRESVFVMAWGARCSPERAAEVAAIFPAGRRVCLGLTLNGSPRHPLYMRADVVAVPYVPVAP